MKKIDKLNIDDVLKDINNVDITKCADECIKNKNCVSWEHHKKDNLRLLCYNCYFLMVRNPCGGNGGI